MRRTFNLKLVMGDQSRKLMVPGELTFEQLYDVIIKLFDLEYNPGHSFKVRGFKAFIASSARYYDCEPEEHWYISGHIGTRITCEVSEDDAVTVSWLKETRQEKDCPVVSEWVGGVDRTDEVNVWLEDYYYLLAEVDGDPEGKLSVYTTDLSETVTEAMLSPERLTFYVFFYGDCLYTLEKNDRYEQVTPEEIAKLDDCVFIRPADRVYVFEMASEYSGKEISDRETYTAFEKEHEDDEDWLLFRRRALRELQRAWVKEHDLWVDICDG